MFRFGNDEKLDSKTAPFVLNITDDFDNTLSVTVSLSVVKEQKTASTKSEITELETVLANAKPVYPDKNNIYQITFEEYIMYQTRNESYTSWDDYEIRQGNYFVLFERSRLLDSLSNITDCQQLSDGTYYPGKWKHFGIYTQNHIIDIISEYDPIIKKLDNDEK